MAIAGIFLAIRTNFDPAVRPGAADLRLRGGDHRRARQSLGHACRRHRARRGAGARRADLARLAGARRPPRLLPGAGAAAARPVSEDGRDGSDDFSIERSTRDEPHRGGRRACCWSSGSPRRRGGRAAPISGCSAKSIPSSRWRACGTCSPAMPASSRSASRPMSGFGGYALFALAMFLGVPPLLAIPLAGVVGGADRAADGAAAVPPAGRLFRHRHLGGWPKCSGWCFAQVSALGGGSGISLPASIVTAHRRRPRDCARWLIYWTGAGAGRRHDRLRRRAAALAQRAWR